MTTETILTEEKVREILSKTYGCSLIDVLLHDVIAANNIEQAVLQAPEIQALREDAETERTIQRAAEVLPRDWQITIEVEQGSGYVNLHFQGDEIEFGEPGDGIADRIKDAISAAMEQQA